MSAVRGYAVVTLSYWGLTLTDGALRMLVLLHFHSLGFSPFKIALLFLLYEFFGILTNLIGGWIASRSGLSRTLYSGLALQIAALIMLSFLNPAWAENIAIIYVVLSQGLSGIAKDLTKMSAKSALKILLPAGQPSRLFHWVALLTGSKNALKGAGFFMGGALLSTVGFEPALLGMALGLAAVLIVAIASLPATMASAQKRIAFSGLFSKTRQINQIALARFFLFGGRDVWFVVGLPVFLSEILNWRHLEIGAFMAAWVVGYGLVQVLAPKLIRGSQDGQSAETTAAYWWALVLAAPPALMALLLLISPSLFWSGAIVIVGLGFFGILFAVNSSVHSYLILAYTEPDKAALNVGFYYMANAAGRLTGTLLSGILYQWSGLGGCLTGSMLMIAIAAAVTYSLRKTTNNIAIK